MHPNGASVAALKHSRLQHVHRMSSNDRISNNDSIRRRTSSCNDLGEPLLRATSDAHCLPAVQGLDRVNSQLFILFSDLRRRKDIKYYHQDVYATCHLSDVERPTYSLPNRCKCPFVRRGNSRSILCSKGLRIAKLLQQMQQNLCIEVFLMCASIVPDESIVSTSTLGLPFAEAQERA